MTSNGIGLVQAVRHFVYKWNPATFRAIVRFRRAVANHVIVNYWCRNGKMDL
ncbi:hypothetical protein [Leptospira interrogans]|uniref:hypothetical protein n=1 Tax=Leptospira interrogans TaxID=173 RepID=UPI0012FB0A62|nr:hypothetical protein [Leptospira interrogans]